MEYSAALEEVLAKLREEFPSGMRVAGLLKGQALSSAPPLHRPPLQ
jgi:hypothetical protein